MEDSMTPRRTIHSTPSAPSVVTRRTLLGGILGGASSITLGHRLAHIAHAQATPAAVELEDGPLVIYSWADYVSPENLAAFGQQFDVTVDYQVFDDNQAMFTKLAAGGSGYDVIVASHFQIPAMASQNLLYELDKAQLPNLANIDPRFLGQPWDPENTHAIPKNFGTDQIIWREDLVESAPASWADFLDAAKGPASGQVTVMDSPDDVLPMALKATGHSVNAVDDDALAAATAWLLELKPHLLGIVPFGAERALLASGQAVMAMSGMSTAPALRMEDPPLPVSSVFPEEGFAYFYDTWAIPATAKNPNLAHAWINFINSPEAAAQEAESTFYGTVNKAAIDQGLIPEDLLGYIQPPDEVMQNLELSEDVSAEGREKRNAVWTEFKSA
jgi:spermidine/putrescine transport system substrate-binding protein